MAWVRKDDQMPIHRKIAPLTDAAYRLLDEAICWCNRNTTDGRIGVDDLASISKRGRPKLAAELVAHSLWHQVGEKCPSPKCPPPGRDGWVIHDYLEYQPSKDKVIREREAKAERQRRWIEARQGKKPRDATKDTSKDASRDASKAASITQPPPRPAPKEGGGGDAPAATAARRQAAGAGDGGRKDQTTDTHPPPSNSRPARAAPPPDNTALRQRLAAASAARHQRDRARADPLAELRTATPHHPPTKEPTDA